MMIDISTNKKNVSIKPVIKDHHLYLVFCDLITMPKQKELLFPAENCEFSFDYERNKLVCLAIKNNTIGDLLKKKNLFSPPHFFLWAFIRG